MYNCTADSKPVLRLINEYIEKSSPVTPDFFFFSFRVIHIYTLHFKSKIQSVEVFTKIYKPFFMKNCPISLISNQFIFQGVGTYIHL